MPARDLDHVKLLVAGYQEPAPLHKTATAANEVPELAGLVRLGYLLVAEEALFGPRYLGTRSWPVTVQNGNGNGNGNGTLPAMTLRSPAQQEQSTQDLAVARREAARQHDIGPDGYWIGQASRARGLELGMIERPRRRARVRAKKREETTERPKPPAIRFVATEEFVGRIDAVDGARAQGTMWRRRGDDDILSADFWLDELSPAERLRAEPGAVFYWTLGYDLEPNGRRRAVSAITLRRTAPVSAEERERARGRAEARLRRLRKNQTQDW
jgi:hypothetical protein